MACWIVGIFHRFSFFFTISFDWSQWREFLTLLFLTLTCAIFWKKFNLLSELKWTKLYHHHFLFQSEWKIDTTWHDMAQMWTTKMMMNNIKFFKSKVFIWNTQIFYFKKWNWSRFFYKRNKAWEWVLEKRWWVHRLFTAEKVKDQRKKRSMKRIVFQFSRFIFIVLKAYSFVV